MTQAPYSFLPRTWGKGRQLRHVWDYKDTAGAILGHVARYDDDTGKDCIPFFTPNGSGMKHGAPPEPRPLFGLDSLKNHAKTVLVVEGEKCAAAAHALGFAAVTSIGGAQAPERSDWTPLQDFQTVCIVPDNDKPGEAYARAVTGILARLPGSRSVYVCRLPGLPEHGDLADWLQEQLPEWDGFSAPPREAGDELDTELRQAIEAAAKPPPAEWTAAGKEAPADCDAWEPPVPLDAAKTPRWPADVFPPPVQGFVDALAMSTETPPELAALMVLSVLATAAQGRYRVRIKSDYFEPLNLWTCCALPPGSRKSAVREAAIRPLTEWQEQRRAAIEPMIKRAESERKTLQGRIEHLRSKAAKAKADDVKTLMQEIEALEHDIPELPRLPQLWSDDVTPENLPVIMGENQECMAILSDEGGIFDTIAGRYSNGVPNLDVYLQGHAGSSVRVNRGSRPSIFLERPCLSIGICPQPDVVKALQDKPGFRGRGLLGRFLYAMPQSNLGRRLLDAPSMPEDVRDAYHETIMAMLAMPWNATKEGKACAWVLKLSPEAFSAWKQFERSLEPGMREGGTFAHMPDWAGKLAGAIARIAAVLHVARYACGDPSQWAIAVEDMSAALKMADALSKHALIAFDSMGADRALDDARAVLAWIQRERLDTFTRRDCHTAHKHRLPRVVDLKEPLDVLCERNYIRQVPQAISARPGPKSIVYQVNPAVIGARRTRRP